MNPVGRAVATSFGGTYPVAGVVGVVGVVGDVRQVGLDRDAPPQMYFPANFGPRTTIPLVLRTSGDPLALAGALLPLRRPMNNYMMTARAALMAVAALTLALPGDVSGQARDSMDARVRAEAVESVAAIMERHYPWPDTAGMIAAHLRGRLEAREYDSITTLDELAVALTRDVRAINGDLHLGVRSGPPPPPPAGLPGTGIDPAERLGGNVGYLRMRIIAGSPAAFEAVVDALRSLEGTDAVILDLRGVPGGSAGMANFLISHFTPPGVASLGVDNMVQGTTQIRHTLATVPGPRRLDVPLYVLVDQRSASAAEDIPFVLQNLGRAIIVGERTAGAGRNVALYPAAHGLSVGVSITRVYDPATGREWERVGVEPEIVTSSEAALEAAVEHALRRVAGHDVHTAP